MTLLLCEIRADLMTYSELIHVGIDNLDDSGAVRAGNDSGSELR